MNRLSTPHIATHPGELILDEIRERGLTQKEFAAVSGIQPSVLSETIRGKRAISLNMSVALEKALGIPADYWMNLQTQYNLDVMSIEGRDGKRETIRINIPVKDRNLLFEVARKFGWACL